MSAPRILFVIQYHFSRFTGGTELQAWMLGTELARRGWDVHYACEMEKPPDPPVQDGITLHALPANPSRWTGNRRPLRELMQRLRPDVIYTRMFSPYLGYAVLDAPPTAFTVWSTASLYDVHAWPYLAQGWQSQRPLAYLRRAPLQLYQDWIARRGRARAKLILAQQHDQQTALQRIGFSSEVLRNSHPPVPATEVQSHEVRALVLWADSVKFIKRPELFLELARRCRDLPADFLMIGRMLDSRYESAIASAARELPNFRYGGFVPLSEVGREFARAHVHVKTSLPIEGFPNTFVQAWLHGVPVVALENDPEALLSEQHLGVCAADMNALEQAVRGLVNDPSERRAIGSRAREFAAREFDLQRNADRFESLLSSRGVRLP